MTLEQNNIHRMLVARQLGVDPSTIDPLSSDSSGSSSATNVPNIITVVTILPGGGQSTVTITGSLSATTSSNTVSGNTVSGSGSSSSNLPSSLAGTTSGNSGPTVAGANKSSPIGAIVGGVLGGLLFVIVVFFFLYYRRTKKKRHVNEVEQVQPFYDNPSSRAGPSSTSQYEASGAYRSQQTPEVGNRRGFSARKAATLAATSPQSSNANTIPNFPTAPLFQPNGNREEPLAESSQPVTSRRVLTHEDSGFRMPQAGGNRASLQSIIEYPPAYTPG